MASTNENDVVIYALVDDMRRDGSFDNSAHNEKNKFSTLFKLKVAELQELIQVIPDSQKMALWDCWNAAQEFINACFEKILKELSIKDSEHAASNQQGQDPGNSKQSGTSGPNGTSFHILSPINVQVETLCTPESCFQYARSSRNTDEEEFEEKSVNTDERNRKEGQTDWDTEIMTATVVVKADDDVQGTYASSKDEMKKKTSQKSMTVMSEANISEPDNENVVHVQVERIDKAHNVNVSDEELSVDEEQPVIILQNSDVQISGYNTEVSTESNKLSKTAQRKRRKGKIKLRKKNGGTKGRPRRKEFSEMCIPVTKEDGEKVFQCGLCHIQMSHYPNLEVHLRSHTGQRPFSCSKCGKSFTTKGNLKEHEAIHDTDRQEYECEICGKMFKQLKCLKIHTRIHTGEKPYKCNVCERAFTQPGVLQSHLLIHSGEKNHLCVTCGKSFRLKAHLELHKKGHEGNKDFKCDVCSFATITKSGLSRHMAKHEEEKRYCCTVCQKKFTRAQYLSEHMNIHSGKMPYHCTECDAAFALSAHLYCHKRKHRREMAEKLLGQEQCKNVMLQSSTSQIKDSNKSHHLNMVDRYTEILTGNQTTIPKIPRNSRALVRNSENQSSVYEIVQLNKKKFEDGTVQISLSESVTNTDNAVESSLGKGSDSVAQVTENLWAGDEQYVELVIGQDISMEDLNSLVSSKVISFRQPEGSMIGSATVPISIQE